MIISCAGEALTRAGNWDRLGGMGVQAMHGSGGMTFNQLLTLALQARRAQGPRNSREFWYNFDVLAIACKAKLVRAQMGRPTVNALRDIACG